MTVMNISRVRGEAMRHIREGKTEASLCGVMPKPINPDKTVLDCWITIMATDNPANHANCDRCIAVVQKGRKK